METITSFVAVLAGVLLRLAIPIIGTSIVIHFLRKWDAHWRKEARLAPLPVHKTECWQAKGCSPAQKESCAAASSSMPCWQVFRQSNGYLREDCISCGVFVNAPTPALKN